MDPTVSNDHPADPADPADDDQLLQLVVAIADGREIDWAAYTSGRESVDQASVTALTPSLQRLQQIVRGHQRFVRQTPVSDELRKEPDGALVTDPGVSQPETWGRLLLRDRIGRGSFGEVYRAWDPNLAREVALKLLTGATSSRMAESAFEEGRRLARIRHPNVVTVHGAERIDGLVGIWMEYVPGRTLAQEIADGGPLPADDAAAVALSVLHALEAVHAAGLLHRDVKAQNVMRDRTGRIVLGDFGTGVEIRERDDAETTIAGTPLYLAPEILEGSPASEQSDVYSVGVLLFFLATGRYPVAGRTLAEIKRAHRQREGVSIRSIRADLPVSFSQVVDNLLDLRPGHRYPTAAASAAAVGNWLAASKAAPSRRRRFLALSMAAALLLSAAAAVTLPSTRARILSSARAAMLAGTPVARQVVDFPCASPPSADGQWMACVEDNPHLLARGGRQPAPVILVNPHTGESRTIREAGARERFMGARISPDGKAIAFVVDRFAIAAMPPSSPGRYDVRIIDTSGSSERVLAELPRDITIAGIHEWASVDDQLILRLWRGSRQSAVLLSPMSGEMKPLFEFSEVINDFRRSPDGRYLVHDVGQSPGKPERDLRLCELATGVCETIVKHPAFDFAARWRPDGSLLFSSDRSGTMGLWSLQLDGMRPVGTPELLRDSGRGQVEPIGFGPDGLIIYTTTTPGADVFRIELGPDWSTTEPVRLSPRAVDTNRSPAWSPDGQQLAYISMRGPYSINSAMRLVIQSQDDGREREFQYEIPANMTRLAWSPDGRTLAMKTNLAGKFGVYLLDPADGRIVRQLRAENPKKQRVEDLISAIDWLDSATIVFAGIDGISTFDIASGEEKRMWTAPEGVHVMSLALTPDKARAAVTQVEGSGRTARFSVASIDLAGKTAHEIFRAAPDEALWVQAWTLEGKDVLVARWDFSRPFDLQRRTLWRVPGNGDTPRAVLLRMEGLDEVRLHPGGKQLVLSAGSRITELWMTTLR